MCSKSFSYQRIQMKIDNITHLSEDQKKMQWLHQVLEQVVRKWVTYTMWLLVLSILDILETVSNFFKYFVFQFCYLAWLLAPLSSVELLCQHRRLGS